MIDLRIISINSQSSRSKSKGTDLWTNDLDRSIRTMPCPCTQTSGSSKVCMSGTGIVNQRLTGFDIDTPATTCSGPCFSSIR